MEAELAGLMLQLHFSPASSVMVQDLLLPNTAGFLSSFPAQIFIRKNSVSPLPLPALKGLSLRLPDSSGALSRAQKEAATEKCLGCRSLGCWAAAAAGSQRACPGPLLFQPSFAVCCQGCVVRWGRPWL